MTTTLKLPPSAETLPPLRGLVEPAAEPLMVPHLHVCPDCQRAHESLFRGTQAVCPDCNVKRQRDVMAARDGATQEELRRRKVEAWYTLCPPDYRRTSWQTHPELSPVCRALARNWLPPKTGVERGLGLFGPTGRGKTRAMYAILQRLHFGGGGCCRVDATTYADAASVVQDMRAPWGVKGPARDLLARCKTARVLYFDDLGKEQSTPGVAHHMHEMLEHRKREYLPTLWTSERSGEELAQFLGANYADGIVRRLRDMCAIFHTEADLDEVLNLGENAE